MEVNIESKAKDPANLSMIGKRQELIDFKPI